MKKTVGIVVLIMMLGFIAIIFLPKQSFIDEDNRPESSERIEAEEDNMKKRIDKVQKFNPGAPGNNSNHHLSFSLSEMKNTTSSHKSFEYIITNEGTTPEKLSFSTSQRYEYELTSKEQGFFQRYSDGKMFMQVLQDITLLPKEEVSYTISLPLLANGEYILTVYSTTHGMNDSRKTITFTINE